MLGLRIGTIQLAPEDAVPIALGLVLGLLIRAGLLMIGGRYLAKTPNATFWRSLAALGLGYCVTVFLYVLMVLWASDPGLESLLLCLLLTPLVMWRVIALVFRISLGRAILAWLPTLAPVLIAAAVLIIRWAYKG